MNTASDNQNNNCLNVIKFDFQSLEQDYLFDFWRESIKPLFLAEMKENHDVRHIYHKSIKLDRIVVAKGGFSSQLFVRDRKHLLRNDDSDHIVMQWYAKGSCHVYNGARTFIQSPEHVVMMDLGYESFSNTISPFSEVISIIFPRELLREFWGPIDNLAGLKLPVNSTRGSLLKNFMVSLVEEIDTIKVADTNTVVQATMQMVSSMFHSEFKQTDVIKEIVDVELKLLIKDFIAANLRNPKLSAEMLLERFHCSRAKLYRLFQKDGGVIHYINQLRLQRCYKNLVSKGVKRSQINKVAEYWGFSNRQQFTRQFRQNFGLLPSDVVINSGDRARAREAVRTALWQSQNRFTNRFDRTFNNNIDLDSNRLASWFRELGYTTNN